MNMSKDDYIKKKFQEDDIIPDRVNQVFEDFKKKTVKLCNEEIVKNEVNVNQNNNTKTIKQHEKVVSFFSYKNINKILSVAAVFLCVVLVRNGNISKK